VALLSRPIKEYDGRQTLRSLADALAQFRDLGALEDDQSVQLKAIGIQRPDGRKTGIVGVLGPIQRDGSRWIIWMPPSGRFTARSTGGESHTYDIARLNEATSDSEGNVELAEGQFLHNVDLTPTPLLYEFTQERDKIVRLALKFLRAEDQCYRQLHNTLPDVKILDYAAVAKVQIPNLKRVQQYILKSIPMLSPTRVATALRLSGMKLPRS
jgi:hypothetical protein